jgi:hypothetical protein
VEHGHAAADLQGAGVLGSRNWKPTTRWVSAALSASSRTRRASMTLAEGKNLSKSGGAKLKNLL